MKKSIKSIFLIVALGAFLTLVSTCTKKKKDEITEISFWTLTEELKPAVAEFEKQNPDIKIKMTVVPNEEFTTKITPVLRAGGDNAPDVFAGEAGYVRRWVESKYWADISDFDIDESLFIPYTLELARDSSGKLRALSWQATPGGTFYRRSMAKKYFGTDDPSEIAKKFSSMEQVLATARELKKKSDGKVYLFGGARDYKQFFLASRSQPWVKDGKFIIDPVIDQFFDQAKIFYDEGLDAKTEQWSPPWFNGMKKDGSVFAYLLPTWGLHYVLKPNAPDSAGDWALTSSPASWYWGGTWVGIYSKSKKKEAAWRFIKALTIDPEFTKWWAKKTGDFLSNVKTVNAIKDSFSEEYLGGQNHYLYFSKEARKIKTTLFTKYDTDIEVMLNRAIKEYQEGRLNKEGAIKFLKNEVKTSFPEISVD